MITKQRRTYHKGKAELIPKEDEEMINFSKWLRVMRLPHTHIANERIATVQHKKKLRMMGTSAGFPDMLILLPKCIAFVEMKREKKSLSRVSEAQQEWGETIELYDYARFKVCYGAGEAIDFIKELLGGKS